MDDLLSAIGRLFGIFKDPVNVLLLLIVLGEAFGIWKLAKFIMDRYDADIKSRADLASAIQGFTKQLDGIDGK